MASLRQKSKIALTMITVAMKEGPPTIALPAP